MRTWCVLLTFVLASALAANAKKEETLEELKARVDSATLEQRVGLCLEIAERQLDAADKLYTANNVDGGRAAVSDVITYSEKARDAAVESGKKLKQAEISVRKMAHKLRDIKGTLNFDDQAPVQDAVNHLEKVRTDLLTKMFNLGNKGNKQ
jgi:hypothetical protein